MKKIMKRKTGRFLTIEEAKSLCRELKVHVGATCVEHKSVYGYTTPELAEKANLRAVCETYNGYTFAYIGTVNEPFEGYRVFVIAIKRLPSDFEHRFPDYVVIG